MMKHLNFCEVSRDLKQKIRLLTYGLCFAVVAVQPCLSYGSEPVIQICSGKKSSLSTADFQRVLSEFSVSDQKSRAALISRMNENQNPCRLALESRLNEIRAKPADFISNTGRNAALTLGLVLELPQALTTIEAELEHGHSAEWLELLKTWDRQAYRSVLKKWLVNEANKRRTEMGMLTQDPQNYGLRQIEDVRVDEKSTKRATLALQLYLDNATAQSLTAEEFLALNAHYASLRSGVRRLFKDTFANVVKKSPAAWVQAFRAERSWTQFQLLELMEASGGAEIVRELLWLSEHHIDKRIKLRAQSALTHLTL